MTKRLIIAASVAVGLGLMGSGIAQGQNSALCIIPGGCGGSTPPPATMTINATAAVGSSHTHPLQAHTHPGVLQTQSPHTHPAVPHTHAPHTHPAVPHTHQPHTHPAVPHTHSTHTHPVVPHTHSTHTHPVVPHTHDGVTGCVHTHGISVHDAQGSIPPSLTHTHADSGSHTHPSTDPGYWLYSPATC